AQQGSPRERQVADRIQHLVANELVREARSFRIENTVVADYERIFQRGAKRVAGVPQARHIAQEAECASARNVTPERFRLDVERQRLTSDQRVLELDLRLHAEATRIWPHLAVGIALRHPYGLEHLDVAAWPGEDLEAYRIRGRHEWRRAAVHDRRFRAVDFDDSIVDTEARERSQHMLGGGHERAGGIAEHSSELGGGHRAHIGGNFAFLPSIEPGAEETQPGIGIGRMQGERDG